ncbi:MAG TPA: M20/M25/M40 family metallo-hydrolase [Steroidobacter sp.]|uniref:M20/M25/M40 family metallo-hydrolase n=1 Tax=Steroidobacter sp. TaxID=1978227 RepID=UPI002ED81299
MTNENSGLRLDRRTLIKGAIASAATLSSAAAFASAPRGKLKEIRRAVDAGHEQALRRIQDWIRLPTVAAEQLNIEQGADYMMQLATEAGFKRVRRVATGGIPAVFGVLDVGAKHTVGLYFMYDVKQFDEPDWMSPPLEPVFFDHALGRALRARGAINHKGPEGTFLAAIHAFRSAGVELPVNLALLAEGEEEIGSPNLRNALNDAEVLAELQRTDAVFMPTAMQGQQGEMGISLGAKGVIECELIASGERWGRGPVQDIHSGMKASVDSPVWRLVEALSTLVKDGGNTPAIDGWYEHYRPLTDRQRAMIAKLNTSTTDAELKSALGLKRWMNDMPLQEAMERLASEPTVNIEGLVAGYTGPGGKTILPGRATAKLDFRIVPDMTAADCEAKLRAHLQKRGFGDIEIKVSGGYDPTETSETSGLVRAEQAFLEQRNIPHTITPRIAGSYPGYIYTGAPLRKPFNQFGLGYGGKAHAPDEFYLIDSNHPKIAGMREATMGYVEFLYALASAH